MEIPSFDELTEFILDDRLHGVRKSIAILADVISSRKIDMQEFNGPFTEKKRMRAELKIMTVIQKTTPPFCLLSKESYDSFERARRRHYLLQSVKCDLRYENSGHSKFSIARFEYKRLLPELMASSEFEKMWHGTITHNWAEFSKICGKLDHIKVLAGKSADVRYLNMQENLIAHSSFLQSTNLTVESPTDLLDKDGERILPLLLKNFPDITARQCMKLLWAFMRSGMFDLGEIPVNVRGENEKPRYSGLETFTKKLNFSFKTSFSSRGVKDAIIEINEASKSSDIEPFIKANSDLINQLYTTSLNKAK